MIEAIVNFLLLVLKYFFIVLAVDILGILLICALRRFNRNRIDKYKKYIEQNNEGEFKK